MARCETRDRGSLLLQRGECLWWELAGFTEYHRQQLKRERGSNCVNNSQLCSSLVTNIPKWKERHFLFLHKIHTSKHFQWPMSIYVYFQKPWFCFFHEASSVYVLPGYHGDGAVGSHLGQTAAPGGPSSAGWLLYTAACRPSWGRTNKQRYKTNKLPKTNSSSPINHVSTSETLFPFLKTKIKYTFLMPHLRPLYKY